MAILMMFAGLFAFCGWMITALADCGTTAQVIGAVAGGVFGLAALLGH